MKYRIKITTYKNGRKTYTPQRKGHLWGWNNLDYKGEEWDLGELQMESRKNALDSIDLNYEGNTEPQTIEFEYINK